MSTGLLIERVFAVVMISIQASPIKSDFLIGALAKIKPWLAEARTAAEFDLPSAYQCNHRNHYLSATRGYVNNEERILDPALSNSSTFAGSI